MSDGQIPSEADGAVAQDGKARLRGFFGQYQAATVGDRELTCVFWCDGSASGSRLREKASASRTSTDAFW